jgi:hypothetical protein
MPAQPDLNLGKHVERSRDLFLCHNGANKAWVESLAVAIRLTRDRKEAGGLYRGAPDVSWR